MLILEGHAHSWNDQPVCICRRGRGRPAPPLRGMDDIATTTTPTTTTAAAKGECAKKESTFAGTNIGLSVCHDPLPPIPSCHVPKRSAGGSG